MLRIVHIFSFSPPQIYQIDVHRIVDSAALTPWVEGNGAETSPRPPGCVFVNGAFGVAWVGAGDGGDANNQTQPNFDSTPVARAIIDESTMPVFGGLIGNGEVVQWDITSLVNDWITGEVPNHGVMLRDITSDGTFRHIFLGAREGLLTFSDPIFQPGPRLISLGAASNGIDPLTEEVTLTIGNFTTTIPAGSFESDDEEYEFEGQIDGVELEVEIGRVTI